MYDKLATKVNKIDTSGFVLNLQCNTDKSSLEKAILWCWQKNTWC